MKISVIVIGKTSASYLREGTGIYLDRLKHYTTLSWTELPDVAARGLTPVQQKEREGESILKHLKNEDVLILLDERGDSFSSREWATWLQKKMNAGTRQLTFVIGGAHGFSDAVYARANGQLSFSRMTFPHELIRLVLAEQLYRAFTILRGEGYHHD